MANISFDEWNGTSINFMNSSLKSYSADVINPTAIVEIEREGLRTTGHLEDLMVR